MVDSLSDFGARSDPPTHPELLDWLAWNLVHTDHWSLKALHRRIMLSDAYQQASLDRPEARRVDSENRLYWRMNRQRLDFEAMRDSMLAVSRQLDPTLGGRPVDIESPPFSTRRSIYARIDRNNFSPLLRTFDYPNPDATSPGRPLTTVPQQTLYAMNAPFVQQTAQTIADQIKAEIPGDAPDTTAPRIAALYRRILSREPSATETELATQFLQQHPDNLMLLAQTLLLTNEFLFVD